MDIRCPVCGEPWDADGLHELVEEEHSREEWLTDGRYDQCKYDRFFDAARKAFRAKGCEVFGTKHNDRVASPLIGEILDLAGDDIDGALSDLDDARALGLL